MKKNKVFGTFFENMISKCGSRKAIRVDKTLKPYIMKRGLLLLLGMFMMVSTVEANNGNKLLNRIGFHYSYDNSVNFIERGVEFFVFTNGEFDFDTRFDNRRVQIRRDFRGRIRRVGRVYINYDAFGNVSRIGNVFMRYYRNRLTNVGNLSVRYDRWGYPLFYGNVKNNYFYDNGIRINLNIGDICNYNDAYFYRNDFRRNYSQIREDRNYYYYRANPNAKIGKRSQILRRRKPVSKRTENSSFTRKRNNSYRKPASVVNSKRNIKSDRRSTSNRNSNTTNRKSDNSKREVKKIIKRNSDRKEKIVRKRRN